MKKYYILIMPLLIISTYVFALNEQKNMHNDIEDILRSDSEITKYIGNYTKSSIRSSGVQCSGTCDSNFKDLEFEVYGTKGCIVVLVETYESFPVYKINSLNISYYLNPGDHSNTSSTIPCSS